MTQRILASAVVGAIAFVLTPSDAGACGGLFCSTTPVDQNAERILFTVEPSGAVTATVEIAYTGDPSSFSWIVPVTETPTSMSVAPASSLRMLDMATAPRIIPPPTYCSTPFDDDGIDGSGWSDAGVADADGGGVEVEDLPVVGPYDPEVISSDDPNALVQWLESNSYTITEEMKPFIALYVENGFKFLGVKLVPAAGVADIAPLSFTCPNGAPFIPLMLTAVASEPEMGVLVFIAAAERYASMSFRMLEVESEQVRFDPRTRRSNYYALASWLVDEEGGKAFITEYAQPASTAAAALGGVFLATPDAEDARSWVEGVLDEHPYLTRLYTRISGWEMDDDPAFAPLGASAPNVSNVHDLSSQPAVDMCPPADVPAAPCGETYCGAGQRCATTTAGLDGCVCGEGFVARGITAPRGAGMALMPTVTCQDVEHDVMQSIEGEVDPCAGFTCGQYGVCLPVNGFPTCDCFAGYAAHVDWWGPGALKCSEIVETHGPEAILWSPSSNRVPAVPVTPNQPDDPDELGDVDWSDPREWPGVREGDACACGGVTTTETEPAPLGAVALLLLVVVARGGRRRECGALAHAATGSAATLAPRYDDRSS